MIKYKDILNLDYLTAFLLVVTIFLLVPWSLTGSQEALFISNLFLVTIFLLKVFVPFQVYLGVQNHYLSLVPGHCIPPGPQELRAQHWSRENLYHIDPIEMTIISSKLNKMLLLLNLS